MEKTIGMIFILVIWSSLLLKIFTKKWKEFLLSIQCKVEQLWIGDDKIYFINHSRFKFSFKSVYKEVSWKTTKWCDGNFASILGANSFEFKFYVKLYFTLSNFNYITLFLLSIFMFFRTRWRWKIFIWQLYQMNKNHPISKLKIFILKICVPWGALLKN